MDIQHHNSTHHQILRVTIRNRFSSCLCRWHSIIRKI